MSAAVGWVVSCQDFRGRLPGSRAKAPPVTRAWFATLQQAEQHKLRQRELNQSSDYLICITPAKYRAPRLKEIKKPSHQGAMDWR
jgi:hypothetical protein